MTAAPQGPRGIAQGLCPYGLGMPYEACCGRFISAVSSAPTAEALMRSRYSAYVLGRIDYLKATTLPAQQAALFAERGPSARLLGNDDGELSWKQSAEI